ncbi:MAG: glycosyltransferase, partial [Thermoleophilia bacterium]
MLNWLTRYSPAAAVVLGDAGSILDVGCGPHGLACIAPDVPFVGADVAFPATPADSMVPVVLELGPELPFPDASFDTVLCLDVLEHVPPADRVPFLHELARVAARRVVLACPTDAAQPLDDLLRTRLGRPLPDWLEEHGACGLPTDDELRALLGECFGEFAATPLAMPNELLCSMIVLADTDVALRPAAVESFRRHGAEWAKLLEQATFGASFRAGWVLERSAPRAALVPGGVDRDELERAVAALAGTVALDTDAELKLWLSPDWGRPETWLGPLARYLAHAPADGSVCLCLHAGPDPQLAAQLASAACEVLAAGREFGDVLLVDGAADRDAVVPVRSGGDVLAALGVPAPPPPAAAAQIVERARRGKAIADELRAIADRHVFARAGDPWLDPEPLVSVRIPTWNGHERLVARTIPSILRGTYGNVEVLVCSDGPDRAAREAVEALAARDPRVRYLELPERPTHPANPWSFWQTTGLRAANRALDEARGRFIAPLDHDDEFTETHIADLLARARERRVD